MENFQEKYDTLVKKYNALLAENEELKSILLQHGIVYPVSKIQDEVPGFSSINLKNYSQFFHKKTQAQP